MDEDQRSVAGESTPGRRRSARLSSPPADGNVRKMAAVKRSIVVKKILPRKTTRLSAHNKENVPRLSEGSPQQQQKKKASTPGPARTTAPRPAMPSPILPSSPPRHHNKPAAAPQDPAPEPQDPVWSQKVRRSYSRLSDPSLHSPSNPHSRVGLFGFDELTTPQVLKARSRTTALEASSFSSLLEGEDGGAEPDLDIPGIAVAKKRRRRKAQQINLTELDALSAQMNAEFEEAEGFELVVE